MAQPKDFGFGSEEQMIKDVAKKFLSENAPVEKLRALVAKDPHAFIAGADVQPASFDKTTWSKVTELGWTSLPVPERADGIGMKMVGVVGLVEELGRAAFPSPLIATYFAAFALREAGSAVANGYLAQIAAGKTATLALANADGSYDAVSTPVQALESGEKATLSGTVYFVQDARKADFFVVAAQTNQGIGLYSVPAGASGLSIEADRIVDPTHDQARLSLRNVSAEVIAASPTGAAAVSQALPSIWSTIAADMVGAAEWLLQTTVEYAKVREQFDRPIGFFQAVKHPLVDVMVAIDNARSLLYNAACAIDTEPENAEKFARMAKAQASDAAAFAADRAVQLHGGIGFTWECDVHLFFKRIKHNQFLFGDGRHHRRRLAAMLLDG